MNKIVKFVMAIVTISAWFGLPSCNTAQRIPGEYASFDFKTECMGADASGMQRVKAWGRGADRQSAIEQAKRNALETVIFDGINAGNTGCDRRPVVTTVNAREKHKDYFRRFFSETGQYRTFITIDDSKSSQVTAKDKSQQVWSVTAIINMGTLRDCLINDNIISK